MNRILCPIVLIVLILAGCVRDIPDTPIPNKPPTTMLWLFPDSSIAQGPSRQHIRWWGEDPDGVVKGYLFASDSIKFYDSTGTFVVPDTLAWRWRTVNDTLIAFPLEKKQQTFYVAVRAVDNTFTDELPDQAVVRFTPFTYWDKNMNGQFDGNDQQLSSLVGAYDPKGAMLGVPLVNQPPSVIFAPNPYTGITMQQPETTYTAATFAWIGTDPDGDKTIVAYRIALNDSANPANWVTIPGNISMVTLFVPRSRSDSASAEVAADLYSGKFLNRQRIGSIPGLKLDSSNTFFLQAQDIAGDVSPVIRLPQAGKTWFVKKPTSQLLTIADYITSDAADARRTYQRALSNTILPGGIPTGYNELNIGRGLSSGEKSDAAAGTTNPKFGVMVPPFIDPAFIYTLYLYDYVFWYTDIYPAIPVAQLSLFQYTNTMFSGHRGKVIFSTSFRLDPDPRKQLRDFAPIDSISSVDLVSTDPYTGLRLLPAFGDNKIPNGYYVYPDSSNPSAAYPPLRFTPTPDRPNFVYSVYMRPIYRRADASYIYHMQPDATSPTRTTISYACTPVLNELKAVAANGSAVVVCGSAGVISTSFNNGAAWTSRSSGTSYSLNATKFFDASNGWIVGDTCTILQTVDGGVTWSDRSIIARENLLGLDLPASNVVVAVGTKGILLRTSDGGASWTSRSSNTNGRTLRSVQFVDANNGIAVGDTTIIVTTDGGLSWSAGSHVPQQQFNSVHYLSESSIIIIGNNGIMLKTMDGGRTWSLQTLPAGELRSVYFADQWTGWICGRTGTRTDPIEKVFRTTDGGSTWTSIPTGVTQHLNAVSFSNSSEGWCTGTGGVVIHSTDGGVNWTTQPKGILNVAVIDGAKSFVFIGLPLHLLNDDPLGQPGMGDRVHLFFEHVLLHEFGN